MGHILDRYFTEEEQINRVPPVQCLTQ